MIRKIFYLLSILILWHCTSCEAKKDKMQSPPVVKSEITPDISTEDVLVAFSKLKTDSVFIQSVLGYYRDARDVSFYDGERPIVIGDINKDGKTDALMPFSIGFMSGYKSYNFFYYAIFLNQNGKLKWEGNFNRKEFPSVYDFPEQVLTFEKVEKDYLHGYISKTSFSTKTPVLLQYDPEGQTFEEVKLYPYYWNYKDLKLNGKLPLNTTKKEILDLLGKPDRMSDFFSDCNYNNGPKKVFHYKNLELYFNNRDSLENEEYRFDNQLNFSIQLKNIKLDHKTTYNDILKLSPEIIKQQPSFEDEEAASDPSFKIIYIPLKQKIVNDNYYDSSWMILWFKNNYLNKVEIPTGDCSI